MAVSEAKRRANKKWREKNREKEILYAKKSNAKNYILNADPEMIKEVKAWVLERENELKTLEVAEAI